MLDGLQTVPWYDLHAATGTAEEVPDLLRRLADEDLQRRSDALEHLRELIYHQTSLYAVSSASVPFLIELATTPTVHDRDQIVDLLAGVASGWRPDDRTWWLQMQQDPAALERHLDAMITPKQWATYPHPCAGRLVHPGLFLRW